MPPAPASPPARSDVPLALWPCAQPDATQPTTLLPGAARALLPAQLARRIVTEYTPPGALLVGPACPSLLHQAARLGRRAVALCPDPATARQASTALDVTVPPERSAPPSRLDLPTSSTSSRCWPRSRPGSSSRP